MSPHVIYLGSCFLEGKTVVYVMPTGMEETPKAALDIHCLQRGGGVALTQMIN